MENLKVNTPVTGNLHLEFDSKPLADGSRRFTVVLLTPEGLQVQLKGFRVDKDALEITVPTFTAAKNNRVYPLAGISPQLKIQLLLLIKDAFDWEKEEQQKEREKKSA